RNRRRPGTAGGMPAGGRQAVGAIRNGCAVYPALQSRSRLVCSGVGHAERAVTIRSIFFAGGLWAFRIYRHIVVDRSRTRAACGTADQPHLARPAIAAYKEVSPKIP